MKGVDLMPVIRCLDCVHCNESEKKCYPQSMDCNSEYDLTDRDIYEYTKTKCDYYKEKSRLVAFFSKSEKLRFENNKIIHDK